MGAVHYHSGRFPPDDRLVQLAILHAEFEALHPFLDGNGRLGRMLVPLFLWQHGLIRAPMFYISAYLESNREAYYDGLLAISRDGDWTGWCQFFLQAVQAQAEDNLGRTQGIIELYERMKVRVDELTHSRYAIRAVDYLFNRPIFQSTEFIRASEIPEPTARRILNLLINAEILEVVFAGRGRRANIYVFSKLLEIAEGRRDI